MEEHIRRTLLNSGSLTVISMTLYSIEYLIEDLPKKKFIRIKKQIVVPGWLS